MIDGARGRGTRVFNSGVGQSFKGYRGKRGLMIYTRSDEESLLVVESGSDAMAYVSKNSLQDTKASDGILLIHPFSLMEIGPDLSKSTGRRLDPAFVLGCRLCEKSQQTL